MNREETARNKHRSGNNCAVSVYFTFYDKISVVAPTPRSEGGKCGAVLSAEKVLDKLGYSTEEFDQKFLELFGSLKCMELRKGKYPCNDFVGTATRMVEETIE